MGNQMSFPPAPQGTPNAQAIMLRLIVEPARHHFREENLARMIVQLLVENGMSFFVPSIEMTFVPVDNNEVIICICHALRTSYSLAVQQLRDDATLQMEEDQPLAVGATDDNHRELREFFQGMDWGEINETATPGVLEVPPNGVRYEALPMGAVILDPRYSHLPTTMIVTHVLDQVRITYGRSSLAHHIWKIMFGNEHAAHPASLRFVYRSLEIGFDEALAEVRERG